MWQDMTTYWAWRNATPATSKPPSRKVIIRLPRGWFVYALHIGVVDVWPDGKCTYTKVNRNDLVLRLNPWKARFVLAIIDFVMWVRIR